MGGGFFAGRSVLEVAVVCYAADVCILDIPSQASAIPYYLDRHTFRLIISFFFASNSVRNLSASAPPSLDDDAGGAEDPRSFSCIFSPSACFASSVAFDRHLDDVASDRVTDGMKGDGEARSCLAMDWVGVLEASDRDDLRSVL